MQSNLEPIRPQEAVELYLQERSTELAEISLKSHEYRLKHFIRWCNEEDIENLNSLSGRDLMRYKSWRQQDGDLAKPSLKTQMDTFRVFIRFCESIEAVVPDLSQKVMSPSLTNGENQRDVMLEAERANKILDFLSKFQYTSFAHTVLTLLWKSGMRTGTVQALDICDYHPDTQRLEARHRPSTGTRLKNKENGERLIALSSATCQVLDDWLNTQRPDVEDDHGRKPLIATTHGRASKAVIRDVAYRWTRPCDIGECPHGRTPESCEATDDKRKTASKCPSSVSPHAIRRGSITHHLSEDVPEKVVSDRMNVSPEVLEKHYDRRSEEVKVEQRREYLEGM